MGDGSGATDVRTGVDGMVDGMVDVAVIGGGTAGLAAATALARSRRTVAVIDARAPRNASSDGVHNFLTRDGMTPGDLLALGRAEVASYGVRVVDGRAIRVDGGPDDFTVVLADGAQVRARRLLVTTGVRDELPNIPGLADRWGHDVLHCPYCHGWEVRDRRIVVVATGPLAAHQAHMFRQLSASVSLVVHTAPRPTDEQSPGLAARGIDVIDGEVVEVVVDHDRDRLVGVRLASGVVIDCDAVVVGTIGRAVDPVIASLGLEVADVAFGEHVLATAVTVDALGATGVPGVWAAGNVADARATVIASAAQGVNAAMGINADLMESDIADALVRGPMVAAG